MNSFRLRLRPAARPTAEPVAWYVDGKEPASWLDEFARWQVPLDRLELYVLPSSIRDRTPRGVLATFTSRLEPATSTRAVGYVLRAGKLYVPANARLDPPVSDAEIEAALVGEVLMLHPAAGLVGFAKHEAISVADCFAPLQLREACWNEAHEGLPAPRRLAAVAPADVPSVDDILDEGRDDIGSQPIDELPKTDPPPGAGMRNTLGSLGKWSRQQSARVVRAVTSRLAAGGSQTSWISRLHDWAGRVSRDLTGVLADRRQSEMERLLSLLANDPDEGLRYAPSIEDRGNTRGTAPPGDRLSRSDANFDIWRFLGGGEPAAPWETSWQTCQILRHRYRELAEREARLGRFRRAAYIYAELLDDAASAASVLVRGRHFREAAILYRDRLKLPLEAAKSFEQGGLFTEAIDLFEQEAQFEKAGDLWKQIGRDELAEQAYRRAVAEHRQAGNLLAAAGLLETKLDASDEALDLLASAWPWSQQAGACLGARIALLGRLGRHEQTARLVDHIKGQPTPSAAMFPLTQAFADRAHDYPDQGVRDQLADSVRVVAGRRLPKAAPAEANRIAQLVGRLVPEDDLLSRDAARYAADYQRSQSDAGSKRPDGRRAIVVAEFALPGQGYCWQKVAVWRDGFVAAGTRSDGLTAVRGAWDGYLDAVTWKQSIPNPDLARSILAADFRGDQPIVFTLSGARNLGASFVGMKQFPRSDRLGPARSIGTPSWLPDHQRAAAYGTQGVLWTVRQTNTHLSLAGYAPHGSLITIEDVLTVHPDSEREPRTVPLVVNDETMYIAYRETLTVIHRGRAVELTSLPGQVTDLASSWSSDPSCVVATIEEGGAVLLTGGRLNDWTHIEQQMSSCQATFTLYGHLILVSREQGRVFPLRHGRSATEWRFDGPGEVPIAVVPVPGANGFAIFTEFGNVFLYRIV